MALGTIQQDISVDCTEINPKHRARVLGFFSSLGNPLTYLWDKHLCETRKKSWKMLRLGKAKGESSSEEPGQGQETSWLEGNDTDRKPRKQETTFALPSNKALALKKTATTVTLQDSNVDIQDDKNTATHTRRSWQTTVKRKSLKNTVKSSIQSLYIQVKGQVFVLF